MHTLFNFMYDLTQLVFCELALINKALFHLFASNIRQLYRKMSLMP